MTDETAAAVAKPTTYFHCAPITLAAGSIIQPGNWGRLLSLYETNNSQIQINTVRESQMELGRRIHAPTKPSRLNCVFALPSLQEAIAFRDKHQRMSIIHEVGDCPDAC